MTHFTGLYRELPVLQSLLCLHPTYTGHPNVVHYHNHKNNNNIENLCSTFYMLMIKCVSQRNTVQTTYLYLHNSSSQLL